MAASIGTGGAMVASTDPLALSATPAAPAPAMAVLPTAAGPENAQAAPAEESQWKVIAFAQQLFATIKSTVADTWNSRQCSFSYIAKASCYLIGVAILIYATALAILVLSKNLSLIGLPIAGMAFIYLSTRL